MGSFTLIKISYMQIYTSCIDGGDTYTVELTPTYSSPTLSLNISNTTKFGETVLTLSSDEVKFNEMYKATVSMEGGGGGHFSSTLPSVSLELPLRFQLIYFCRYI